MFSAIGEGRESMGEQPEVQADSLERSSKMPVQEEEEAPE